MSDLTLGTARPMPLTTASVYQQPLTSGAPAPVAPTPIQPGSKLGTRGASASPSVLNISADQAYKTLKAMYVMEKISGKPTDPAIKFDLVKQAAPAYIDDLAGKLTDLPKYAHENTRASQKEAREVFERIEIFTWALSSSTDGLADSSGPVRASGPNGQYSLAGQLFDLIKDISAATDQKDRVNESSGEEHTPRVKGKLGALISELQKPGDYLIDDFIGVADGIEALAARDDDFALIGQAAAIFAYAQSLASQNRELLGPGTEQTTEEALERIFTHIQTAASSLLDIYEKNGRLPSDRFNYQL